MADGRAKAVPIAADQAETQMEFLKLCNRNGDRAISR
jgi:hypothetical protein